MKSARFRPLHLSLALVASLLTGALQARADSAAPPEAREALVRLIPSVAVRSHDVHVVPLLDRRASAGPLRIVPAPRASHVRFERDPRAGFVRVVNDGKHPVFLAGGSVLALHGREHVIRANHVLAPQTASTVGALALASVEESSGGDATLVGAIAPRFVRRQIERDASRASVHAFLRRFEPVLDDPSAAKAGPSFAALDDAWQQAGGSGEPLPESLRDPRAVGFATVLNGRVHSMEVFASHELLSSFAPALLRAHAFKARALASHGAALGVLRPPAEDPLRAAREATRLVRTLLADLRANARFRLAAGAEGAWTISGWKGVRGRLDTYAGRMVHAVLYPRAPYQRALYSRTIEPRDPTTPAERGREELGRLQDRGTSTEAEDRRLARTRTR